MVHRFRSAWRIFLSSVILALVIPLQPVQVQAQQSLPQQATTVPNALCSLLPAGGRILVGADANLIWDECWKIYSGTQINLSITLEATADLALAALQYECSNSDPNALYQVACTPLSIGESGVQYTGGDSPDFSGDVLHLSFVRGCYYTYASGPVTKSDTLMAYAQQVDDKLKTMDACPSDTSSGATPTSTEEVQAAPTETETPAETDTPVSKDFDLVGMACSGIPSETGQVGRIVCLPITSNEPFDDPANYTWKLDGQPVNSTSRRLQLEGISTGEHAVTVTAEFHGVQKEFTSIVRVSDGVTPPDFTVTATCDEKVFQTVRTLTCKAAVRAAPADGSLTYQWYWDGVQDSMTGDTYINPTADLRQHMLQVKAVAAGSALASNLATTIIPSRSPAAAAAPGSGQLSLQSAGTTAVVGAGQGVSGQVQPGGKAQVYGKCDQMMDLALLLTLVYYDGSDLNIQTPRGAVNYYFLPFLVSCIMSLSAQPLASLPADGLHPAAFSSQGSAQADDPAPVQLSVQLSAGGLRFTPQIDHMTLTVETPYGTISLQGKGDFGVAVDAATGQAVVGAYQGTLTLQPAADGSQPVSLSAGQMVALDASGAGTVSDLPAAASSGGGALLLVLLCLCLLVMLAVGGVVLFLVLRRRRPKQPSGLMR